MKKMKYFFKINWFKTLYFNFKYFSFKDSLKLPVFVYRQTTFLSLNGEIIIEAPLKTGIVKIGQQSIGIFDYKKRRAIWEVNGQVIFKGKCNIGQGSKISVGPNGTLSFGNKFGLSGESAIVCFNKISFGDECLLSWDILIMDTDFHKIYNSEGIVLNSPKPIIIGSHVWIGCRCTILKGVIIANNNVIGAGSKIVKNINQSNVVVTSDGTNIYLHKENINWMP